MDLDIVIILINYNYVDINALQCFIMIKNVIVLLNIIMELIITTYFNIINIM